MIQTTFDLHLLGREDSSSTSRAGSLGILRGDLGGVAVHQGGLALREGLLEAMATVYFSILSLVDIVEALERFGAFEAGETLGVPGALLRQLSLHLESFPSAPPAGGRIVGLALQTQTVTVVTPCRIPVVSSEEDNSL